MTHQIIAQPDGKLCVFSTTCDDLIVTDATEQELLDFYVALAADTARRDTKRIIDLVLTGQARKVYHQFTMSYDEAINTGVSYQTNLRIT